MKLIAKIDFYLGNDFIEKGKEIETKDFDLIVKLNENGFIQPLNLKELMDFKKSLNKKEEEK